ncbi:MAG: hypothetical protein MUE44_06480 [Oscillatoriaceae cyanobacterium Prado104]|jgi:hypothetical protein|nr:hypothetical protein [Oscillatoriaceae cyanobacterium Prado104]
MNSQKIKIDRISIQSQGIAPPVVQAAVRGLGQELLAGLAQQRDALKPGQNLQVDALNLGTIRVTNGRDAKQLRSEIYRAILRAIDPNLKLSDRR